MTMPYVCVHFFHLTKQIIVIALFQMLDSCFILAFIIEKLSDGLIDFFLINFDRLIFYSFFFVLDRNGVDLQQLLKKILYFMFYHWRHFLLRQSLCEFLYHFFHIIFQFSVRPYFNPFFNFSFLCVGIAHKFIICTFYLLYPY